jgi:hypothetical protein
LFEEFIENFWELKREGEIGNIVGNIRDIGGKPFGWEQN